MSVESPTPRDLRRNLVSESAIYGLLLVSAMLIVVARGEQSSWETFIKVGTTVVVFWVAHVFAHVIAQLSEADPAAEAEDPYGLSRQEAGALRRAVRHAVAHSSGILFAAILPLGIVLLGVLGFISGDTATWTALWIDVALLGLLGYFGTGGWTRRRSIRIAAGGLTALLGLSIMLLKALIH